MTLLCEGPTSCPVVLELENMNKFVGAIDILYIRELLAFYRKACTKGELKVTERGW